MSIIYIIELINREFVLYAGGSDSGIGCPIFYQHITPHHLSIRRLEIKGQVERLWDV